jgi:hypothetical protein
MWLWSRKPLITARRKAVDGFAYKAGTRGTALASAESCQLIDSIVEETLPLWDAEPVSSAVLLPCDVKTLDGKTGDGEHERGEETKNILLSCIGPKHF